MENVFYRSWDIAQLLRFDFQVLRRIADKEIKKISLFNVPMRHGF